MVLGKNIVLCSKSPPWRRRILFDNAKTNTVVWIDIDTPQAKPTIEARATVIELLSPDGPLSRMQETLPAIDLEKLTAAEKRLLDARWAAIANLVTQEPDIYQRTRRARLVNEAANKGLGTHPFIYRALRAYWQGGLCMAALVPRFSKCGAKGIERLPDTDVDGKRGRPRTHTPGVGLNVTPEHLRNMRLAWARFPAGRNGMGLEASYTWMLIHKYEKYVSLRPGEVVKVDIRNYDAVPTLEQFRYRYYKENSWEERRFNRLQRRRFEQQFGRLLSGTLRGVRGPGTRYYIDATVLDVYCVSRLNRNRIVGRPTLYVIVDDFSRLIVGMYVGLEPPCWVGALMALLNASLPKVEFCARYGIYIPESLWPTGGIPLHLMGDRGELESRQATALATGFRMDVENASPRRGDAKGPVERSFNTLQTKFGPYMPGYVDREFIGRDAPDYVLKAAMTVEEVTRALIYGVLWSNTRVISQYDGAPEVIESGTPFIPLELWNWGVNHLRCDVRHYDWTYLRRYLLPVHEARFQRKGLHFARGLYFQSKELFDASWYLQAQANHEAFPLFYDPSDMTNVLVPSPRERDIAYEATLAPRCERLGGVYLSEVMALAHAAKSQNQQGMYDYQPMRAGFDKGIHETVAHAQARAREEHDPSLSNAQRKRDIRANRAEELGTTVAIPGEATRVPGKELTSPPVVDAEASAQRSVVDRVRQLAVKRTQTKKEG